MSSDTDSAGEESNPYNTVEGIKKRAIELGESRVAELIERAENRVIEHDDGYSIGYPARDDGPPSYDLEMFFHLGILTGAALEREYPAGPIGPIEEPDLPEYHGQGNPEPTSRFGVFSKTENHLEAYLERAIAEGWDEWAIQALQADIDQFRELREEYAQLRSLHADRR